MLSDVLRYLTSVVNRKLCTTPVEALRSASKCNTIPEKLRGLLKNKVENNTIMKLLTYKINQTT
jgi:hypothetical protein